MINTVTVVVASWGLIASLQALGTGFSSLFVLRALLGISEAAFTGVPFFLSFFFRPQELAFRTGLFISVAPLATSFAGLLAWLITRTSSLSPIAPWRMLFLVEGFPSIVVAVFVFLHMPDSLDSAYFLSYDQRQKAKARLHAPLEHGSISWPDITSTLRDPKAYLTAFMFFCSNVSFASMPVFLPKILHEMGYSTLRAQVLTAPPFLLATGTVLGSAWLSDRLRSRGNLIGILAIVAASGYAWMAFAGLFRARPFFRYLGVFPAASGFFGVVALVITWNMNNQQAMSSRGASLALLQSFGQLGPLLGVRLYPDEDEPFYTKGLTVCAVLMTIVAILAIVLRHRLQLENRRLAADIDLDIHLPVYRYIL